MSNFIKRWESLTYAEKQTCVTVESLRLIEYPTGYRQAYQVYNDALSTCLEQDLQKIRSVTTKQERTFAKLISHQKKLPKPINWEFYLVGPFLTPSQLPVLKATQRKDLEAARRDLNPDDFKPAIIAQCEDKALAIRASQVLLEFKQSYLQYLLKGYEIHYRQVSLVFRFLGHGHEINQNAEDDSEIRPLDTRIGASETLCGQQAIIVSKRGRYGEKYKTSTLGGNVVVKGNYFALTTAHPFSWSAADILSAVVESDQIENGAESSSCSLSASETDEDTRPDEDRDLNRLERPSGRVYAQTCPVNEIDALDSSIFPQEISDTKLLNGDAHNKWKRASVNWREDWALVPIDNPRYRTLNQFRRPDGEIGTVIGISQDMPTGPVLANTGISTPVITHFSTKTLMLLPGANQPQIVWGASMSSNPGDSGSWMIDENGRACAMIVAAIDEDNEVFCLPLSPIFSSIRNLMEGSPSIPVVNTEDTDDNEESEEGSVVEIDDEDEEDVYEDEDIETEITKDMNMDETIKNRDVDGIEEYSSSTESFPPISYPLEEIIEDWKRKSDLNVNEEHVDRDADKDQSAHKATLVGNPAPISARRSVRATSKQGLRSSHMMRAKARSNQQNLEQRRIEQINQEMTYSSLRAEDLAFEAWLHGLTLDKKVTNECCDLIILMHRKKELEISLYRYQQEIRPRFDEISALSARKNRPHTYHSTALHSSNQNGPTWISENRGRNDADAYNIDDDTASLDQRSRDPKAKIVVSNEIGDGEAWYDPGGNTEHTHTAENRLSIAKSPRYFRASSADAAAKPVTEPMHQFAAETDDEVRIRHREWTDALANVNREDGGARGHSATQERWSSQLSEAIAKIELKEDRQQEVSSAESDLMARKRLRDEASMALKANRRGDRKQFESALAARHQIELIKDRERRAQMEEEATRAARFYEFEAKMKAEERMGEEKRKEARAMFERREKEKSEMRRMEAKQAEMEMERRIKQLESQLRLQETQAEAFEYGTEGIRTSREPFARHRVAEEWERPLVRRYPPPMSNVEGSVSRPEPAMTSNNEMNGYQMSQQNLRPEKRAELHSRYGRWEHTSRQNQNQNQNLLNSASGYAPHFFDTDDKIGHSSRPLSRERQRTDRSHIQS